MDSPCGLALDSLGCPWAHRAVDDLPLCWPSLSPQDASGDGLRCSGRPLDPPGTAVLARPIDPSSTRPQPSSVLTVTCSHEHLSKSSSPTGFTRTHALPREHRHRLPSPEVQPAALPITLCLAYHPWRPLGPCLLPPPLHLHHALSPSGYSATPYPGLPGHIRPYLTSRALLHPEGLRTSFRSVTLRGV